MEYKIYYIFDKSNQNEYDYFLTKNHISKALYALKRNKTESIIKRILQNNNYETRLFKSYINISKHLLIEEIKKIRAFHNINKRQMINYYTNIKATLPLVKDYSLHNLTKSQSLGYGKVREQYVYDLLCKYKLFNTGITRAKYIYSEFDFFDTYNYLYEIKSLTYSVNKYNTAVMNTSKLIYDNYIFIFEYTEGNKKELYYHLYDNTKQYNKRYITPLNRLNTCEIIDIPINDLTKFYDGERIIPFKNPCKLIINKNELKLFQELIWLDDIKNLIWN